MTSNVSVYQIRAEYATIDRLTGQDVRANGVLELLTFGLTTMGLSPRVNIVRIGHPYRRSKTSNEGIIALELSKRSKLLRSIIKLFGWNPYLKSSIEWRLGAYQTDPRNFMDLLSKDEGKRKIFLFDDVTSAFVFSIDYLKRLRRGGGLLIYDSQNYYSSAPKRVVDNERRFMEMMDLVITSSYRDRYYYQKAFSDYASKFLVIPNCFPPISYISSPERTLSRDVADSKIGIAITGPSGLGSKAAAEFVSTVGAAFKNLDRKDVVLYLYGKVYDLISQRADAIKGVEVVNMGLERDRAKYIHKLSSARIGINHTNKHSAANTKKFDYALAGLVILSNPLGAKGEPLPYEYTYIDEGDLRVKLEWLIENVERLMSWGEENYMQAIRYSITAFNELRRSLESTLL
ncbi:MAG: hypothetical protein NZ920_01100 [Aigarchaeota archaeon]|nr:hypothetical protein [Aigarchaeota archaeon]MDW8093038.1 hypothetical protein [Nitrososphaerota archaeon]